MIDAAAYDVIETLKNGIDVQIRSIRADDKERISEAFRNLEPKSIYTRFFHTKKALSDEELKAATEVDFDEIVALVATIGKERNETIIAGGRYIAFDAADNLRSAEVAFTVEEDYQGQGLAGRLLRHLVYIARQKGIAQFEAEVLPRNNAMLTVFSRSGLPLVTGREAGIVRVTLMLTEEVD